MDSPRKPGKCSDPPRYATPVPVSGAFASLVILLLLPASTEAQPLPPEFEEQLEPPGWVAEFSMLSGNALLGGLTAGVRQHLSGGSFSDGFLGGFIGGTVIYAGKRVAAERRAGAGVVGRGLAGAGASVIRNASTGQSAFASVVVPVGPARLYVTGFARPGLRFKVDLNTMIMTAVAALEPQLEFDLGASISAGAPVFNARERLFGTSADTVQASGKVVENVIFLSRLPWRPSSTEEAIFAHERVHVLQRDQLFLTVTEPMTSRLIEKSGLLAPLARYVDVHPTDLLLRALSVPFADYYDRPWELEAYYLAGQ